MRYKVKVLERIETLDATVNKLQFEINRGYSQQQLSDTVAFLKDQLSGLQDLVSLEHDNFEQQFSLNNQ